MTDDLSCYKKTTINRLKLIYYVTIIIIIIIMIKIMITIMIMIITVLHQNQVSRRKTQGSVFSVSSSANVYEKEVKNY